MIIALLGFGTVGKGVYDILHEPGHNHQIKYILDRHPEKTDAVDCTVTLDYESILDDPEVDVVIELLGGAKNAYPYVTEALKHGKHVITANKALISKHFEALTTLARAHGKALRYEASVGAAIIVLDPLKTIAKIDHIHEIKGIINGSTNEILTRIFKDGLSLEDALADAKAKGYIESGTNDDLEGLDLMRKINILSMIAYHQPIAEEKIQVLSLSNLSDTFVKAVKERGWIMKYVATSILDDDGIHIHLEPVLFDKDHPYARINNTENIIHVYGHHHPEMSWTGQGAGRYETASAVIYDLERLTDPDTALYEGQEPVLPTMTKFRFLVERKEHVQETIPVTIQTILNDPKIKFAARIGIL